MSKKVVIFGGSGFLGSHVADFLTKRKYDVFIFDIKKSLYKNRFQKFILGDTLNKTQVNKALKNCSYVFNFSGEADIGRSKKFPLETLKSNVIGTANILDSCLKNKIKKYLHASTVYVNSEQGGFYRSSKHSAELIIENYNEFFGLDFVIMRFGSLYGPRANKFNFISNIIEEALNNRQITRQGNGEEIREYIHIFDAAELCCKLIQSKYRNVIVNITGSQPYKVKNVLQLIKEILGKDINIKFNKKKILKDHYKITPYSYKTRMAKKLINDGYIELGEGILNLINDKIKNQS
tara:strand:+ start:1014 stop:1892 length:879 start_codon:yes stop_codon:yes gene_type:complete